MSPSAGFASSHRVARLAGPLAALAIIAAVPDAALAQSTFSDPRLEGDAIPERAGPGRADTLDATPTAEPDAEELQPTLRLDQRVQDGAFEEPAAPAAPAATATEEPEGQRFDLFSGPDQGRANRVRRDLPSARAGAVRAAAPETVGAEAEVGLNETAARNPFATIGPVRSPTLSVPDAAGRLNTPIAGLRSSLPVAGDDPYAPRGVRVGRFLLTPTLEQSVGVSDNLQRAAGGQGGTFSETALSARIVSDWARHSAELGGAAVYRRNFEGSPSEEPRFDLDGQARLDLDPNWITTLRGALSYSRESAFSADPATPPEARPDLFAYSVGADLERAVGLLAIAASAEVAREEREAATGLAATDDFTTYSAGLRVGYGDAASLQPFASASLGRRVFDSSPGGNRDSVLPAARIGLAFDRGEKFSGELAVGYAWNVPDEGALETLGSPTLDGRLEWSPRRGTDVTLTAATYFDPDRTNLSTSTIYEATLGLRHRATARLDFTALAGAAYRDQSAGIDERTLAAQAGVAYWINRGLAVTANARHERLRSEIETSQYEATSLQVGLRVQR